MYKASVTIATFKRPELLCSVLDALAKQTIGHDRYEIIVCDSGSGAATDDVIEKVRSTYPTLDLSHCHTRNVLAAKRNLGIEVAKYEVVIFMDDDCIPEASFIEKHLSYFDSIGDEKKIVFCGEVRFPEAWANASNYYRFRDDEGFRLTSARTAVSLDFRTIVVMNMSFLKKPFLEHMGGVNESFVGYGMEDQELGWRLEKAGFRIVGRDALILHHELSMNIQGYGKKIFHTARDGAATLLTQCPDAFAGISSLWLIDKDYPGVGPLQRNILEIVRLLLFNGALLKIALRVADYVDDKKVFYSKYFYRYILACYYVQGVNARVPGHKLDLNNWYQ